MTALSVLLGSFVVQSDGFLWLYFAANLVGMILVHAATNVLNDYYDYTRGVDKPGAPTTLYRRHPLVEADLSPRGVVLLSLALYAGAAGCGLFLFFARGATIPLIALLGLFASVFYTAGPIRYKYHGFGEVSVFLMWGPLMVLGSFYVQHGSWSGYLTPLLISIPQGLWVALVILANNLKDIDFDGGSDVRTVAISLGRKRTLTLYTLLAASAYVTTIVFALTGLIPRWALVTILSIPKTIKLIRHLVAQDVIPPDADPLTAQNGMIFGLLLTAALIVERFFPW